MKTRKTLKKRVKITKTGKIMKKQSRTGHLKEKWTSGKKSRKGQKLIQHNKGHRKVIKQLLAGRGRGIR